MSELVKGAVDTWKGLDKKVYSRIEVVENTNKNNVVSTRTYAINDQNGKRKQIKNIYRGDTEGLEQAERQFLNNWSVAENGERVFEPMFQTEAEGAKTLERRISMLKEWERQVQDRGLRGRKGFAEVVNELNDVDYQPIKFYETLLANDPDAGRAFAWEYGIVKQPEPSSISRDSVVYNEIDIADSDKNEHETPEPESQSEAVEPVTVDPSEVAVEGLKKSRWQRVKDAPKMTMARAQNSAFNILDRLVPKTDNTNKEGKRRRAIGKKTAIIGSLALAGVAVGGAYLYNKYLGVDPSHIPESAQKKINSLVDTNGNLTVQHQIDQDTISGLNDKVRGLQERLNDLASQHPGHGSGGNHGMDQVPSGPSGGGSSNAPEMPGSSGGGANSVDSLNLRKDVPWTVAHQLSTGNETSLISQAMSEYGRMTSSTVNFGYHNGTTMIFVDGRVVDPNQMEAINKIIVSLR